jgi:hypothetical protein
MDKVIRSVDVDYTSISGDVDVVSLSKAAEESINRIVRDISNVIEESSSIPAISHLLNEIFNLKYRCDVNLFVENYMIISYLFQNNHRSINEEDMIRQLRDRLEENEETLEELQMKLNRSRNEYLRRQDILRKESENKIAYLAQHLRTFEENRQSSKKSNENLSTTISFHSQIDQDIDLETKSMKFDRPSTSAGILKVPASKMFLNSPRMLSDENLTRVLSNTIVSKVKNSDIDEVYEMSINPQEEVVRRWMAEKERREQLEKRNSEIFQELRQLRDTVQHLIHQ